ncbi:hypothetical protein JAAARDRAFT_476103 [Jaapia argillacea MUCL 33604]|uniref:PARP catalytic domain-containing protein n=1 Tax=Jaapia argillacea MUCL 33604 TaxID=933084 RepID=A0A067PR33_9AGAM|nr:hypothetical protein JAAARDRAFT_476103 [Jaapia argillacea MUCL 33604]
MPVYQDAQGVPGRYCTWGHKEQAKVAPMFKFFNQANMTCIFCGSNTVYGTRIFCGQLCRTSADGQAPAIFEIPPGTHHFKTVVDQLQQSWKHQGKSRPTVRHVYKIICRSFITKRYEAYRTCIETQRRLPRGNENRRWHGTTRYCNLGDPGRSNLCHSPTCGLCGIIRTSFWNQDKLGKVGPFSCASLMLTRRLVRFGRGLYFTSTASKSDDYSRNNSPSPYKALLLNLVVVGQGRKMWQNAPYLNGPPLGFDS